MNNKYGIGKRKCYICHNIKDISEFHANKSGSKVRYECKLCPISPHNYPAINVRKLLIEEADFKCSHCGLQKIGMYAFFDADHIEPLKRRTNKITCKYLTKKDKHKIQILCPNCHRLKTIQDNNHIK